MQAMKFILVAATTIAATTSWADVVINEVFYNAPNDLDDLQWIEFYNDGDAPVDLSDWTLDAGSRQCNAERPTVFCMLSCIDGRRTVVSSQTARAVKLAFRWRGEQGA